MNQSAWMRCAAAVTVLLLLPACADKAKKAEKPAPLVPITQTLKPERLWSASLGGEAQRLRLGLGAAVLDGRVYAAGHGGRVEALALSSGAKLWDVDLHAPLSAGPGVGQGLIAVGSSKGVLYALDLANGHERWHVALGSEILSAPLIGAEVIIVRTVDGKLHGLEPRDGAERWVTSQQIPRLTLRGTAVPVPAGDLVICGYDNGRLVAVFPGSGNSAWEVTVAQPRGSSELARLIDVDGPALVDGEDVFAVSFQGRLVRVARSTGQILWTRDLSSYRGMALNSDSLFLATADGAVVSIDRRNGTEQWRQKALARRALTAPVMVDGHVVVSDFEGVVHWLDAADGHFLARTGSGARVSSAPVAAADLVLIYTDKNTLSAFRARPLAGH